MAVADGGTGSSTAAGARSNLSAAAIAQTAVIPAFIEAPSNKSYKIVVKSPIAFTITDVTTICASGTATLTVKINTTALGGTANSVSSSEESQSHASSNSVAVGDDIVLTFSSVSSCLDVSVMISGTYNLS